MSKLFLACRVQVFCQSCRSRKPSRRCCWTKTTKIKKQYLTLYRKAAKQNKMSTETIEQIFRFQKVRRHFHRNATRRRRRRSPQKAWLPFRRSNIRVRRLVLLVDHRMSDFFRRPATITSQRRKWSARGLILTLPLSVPEKGRLPDCKPAALFSNTSEMFPSIAFNFFSET